MNDDAGPRLTATNAGGAFEAPLHAHVRGLLVSPTVGINERCDALKKSGRRVTKLGLGQSPFPFRRRSSSPSVFTLRERTTCP